MTQQNNGWTQFGQALQQFSDGMLTHMYPRQYPQAIRQREQNIMNGYRQDIGNAIADGDQRELSALREQFLRQGRFDLVRMMDSQENKQWFSLVIKVKKYVANNPNATEEDVFQRFSPYGVTREMIRQNLENLRPANPINSASGLTQGMTRGVSSHRNPATGFGPHIIPNIQPGTGL